MMSFLPLFTAIAEAKEVSLQDMSANSNGAKFLLEVKT